MVDDADHLPLALHRYAERCAASPWTHPLEWVIALAEPDGSNEPTLTELDIQTDRDHLEALQELVTEYHARALRLAELDVVVELAGAHLRLYFFYAECAALEWCFGDVDPADADYGEAVDRADCEDAPAYWPLLLSGQDDERIAAGDLLDINQAARAIYSAFRRRVVEALEGWPPESGPVRLPDAYQRIERRILTFNNLL